MITLAQYFGSKPHTDVHEDAAVDVLDRRNRLREEYYSDTGEAAEFDPDTGTEISGSRGGSGDGGFRLPSSTTGSKNSSHKEAKAVDDYDPKNLFDKWLDRFEQDGNNSKLEEYGLYREHPDSTNTWVHLTTRAPMSKKRTFRP